MKKLFHRFGGVAALLVALLTFTACPLDDKDDDKENGEETEEVTGSSLSEQVPAAVRKQVAKYMPIYDGTTPPNIEGTYTIDAEIVYSSNPSHGDAGDFLGEQLLRFGNQRNGNRTVDGFLDNSENSMELSVVGSGNNFTAFFVMLDDDGNNKFYFFISGTVTSAGIKKFYTSNGSQQVGGSFVLAYAVKDSDGMSERTSVPSARTYEQPAAESKALRPLWRIAPFRK